MIRYALLIFAGNITAVALLQWQQGSGWPDFERLVHGVVVAAAAALLIAYGHQVRMKQIDRIRNGSGREEERP